MNDKNMSSEALHTVGRRIAESFLRASLGRNFVGHAIGELRILHNRMMLEQSLETGVVAAAIGVLESRLAEHGPANADAVVGHLRALRDAIEAAPVRAQCHVEHAGGEPALNIAIGIGTKARITCARLERERFDLRWTSTRHGAQSSYCFNLSRDALLQQLVHADLDK
jgi:hypothetical protein